MKKPSSKSARVNRLQERFVFDPPHDVCFERALWMTRSYKKTEGEPIVIRQAKAFYEVLDQQTLVLQPDELLVGNIASRPRAAYFAPEVFPAWKSYKPGEPCVMQDKRFATSTNISYNIPEEVGTYWKDRPIGTPVGHFVPNYEKILVHGFLGVLELVEKQRAKIFANRAGCTDFHQEAGGVWMEANSCTAEEQDKLNFYEAAAISCRAAIRFAERHAAFARELAEKETDSVRRAELLEIARISEKVPAHPAETFHEALQSFWLTHVMIHICSKDWSVSPGRFDQYMFSYYDRDIREGRITRQQAAELLGCLWIKFNELRIDVDFVNYQNVLLSGVDKTGADATNDLSYLCLEVNSHIRMIQPSLSVRLHDGTPREFLEKCAEQVKNGGGLPAFFGDNANIAALMEVGVSLENARNYAIAGCEEVAVQGKTLGALRAGIFSQAQCLLFALFDGKYPNDDKQFAPATGDATKFASFDQLLEAYKVQLKAKTLECIERSLRLDRMAMENTPYPFVSLVFDGCVGNGRDITAGGAEHNLTTVSEAGVCTTADSLYALKKAVFEDKRYTMAQILEALKNNFEGHEELRQVLLNIPKFGNDLDEVDRFVVGIVDLNHWAFRELDRRNLYGGLFASGSGLSNAFMLGQWVGATPDGRKAGEHLSVSYGPTHGRDVNGPTATLRSVAKIKFENLVGGTLTHLRLNPKTLEGETGTRNLAAMIATFFKIGGMGLHLSVVGRATLEAARREPEKHRDIIVRIGGYSVYYTLLSDKFQQELINRTEH
jgi:formate C-acetyltransferase